MISPEMPHSFWTLRYTCRLAGAKSMVPPLGLLTVAALLPQSWQIRLADLNTTKLRPGDWNWADVVMISGMLIQKQGITDLIREAKKREKTVVVGGPYATLAPDQVLNAGCDILVLGESENTVPQLVRALEKGEIQGTFEADHKPDMCKSPVPRFDLLDFKDYACLPIQTSRGCPFECEFCDIDMLYGRKPRHKTSDQVINELEAIYRLGWRSEVFISDDNFIGNKKYAHTLLLDLIPWMKSHGRPFDFWTQVSIDLGQDREMIDLMTEANFCNVFIGIESPDEEVLRHTHKYQNVRNSIFESLNNICKNGLSVVGSFILGFDTEKTGAGERIGALVDQTHIPMVMVNTLEAIPKTKLWNRLKEEGRLLADGACADFRFPRPNFFPARTESEIMEEYVKAWKYLYKPSRFLSRTYQYYTTMRPTRRALAKKNGTPFPNNLPRAKPPLRRRLWSAFAAFNLVWRQGIRSSFRIQFWGQIIGMRRTNPSRMIAYLNACVLGENMFHLRKEILRARAKMKI